MKKRFFAFGFTAVIMSMMFLCPPLQAISQRPGLVSHMISGAPPTIDGVVNPGEWPGPPQIVFNSSTPVTTGFTYVIPTYIYFCNDLNAIYVLVDAVGDTTDNHGTPRVDSDECLLIFGNGTKAFTPEAFGNGTVSGCTPQGVTVGVGFGPSPNSATIHRIYEWRIPLSSIGASAGQTLDFCSPHDFKFTCSGIGSMPYDASTQNDNIWPPGTNLAFLADPSNRSEWGVLQLQPTQQQSVPTLSEWGMILMGLFLAGAAVWAIKRREVASM